MTVLNFEETPEFKKDVKTLKKSWRSIPSDIENVKLVIKSLYVPTKGVDIENFRKGIFASPRAAILHTSETYEVVKMRLDCKSLGNDKKVRLVFVAIKTEQAICLIEVFSKSKKAREDANRIEKYLI